MKKFFALILALAMVLGLTACGQEPSSNGSGDSGEKIHVTFYHTSADTASHQQTALKFKELLEERSDGRFEVTTYCNGTLGTDREAVEATIAGNITIFGGAASYTGNFVPQANLFDIPYRLVTNETAMAVCADQDMVDALNAYFTGSGMLLAGLEFLGFRTLSCNYEVHNPGDLAGVKVRVMDNPYQMNLWQAMGASPTPLAYNELYTGLQQGTVDGQENPIELTYTQKFYEQQKYLIDTNQIPFIMPWIINEAFYNGLSAEDQALVTSCLSEASRTGEAYLMEKLDSYFTAMEDYGCTIINLTDDEYAQFIERVEPLMPSYQELVGQDLYDTYLSIIAKHS